MIEVCSLHDDIAAATYHKGIINKMHEFTSYIVL